MDEQERLAYLTKHYNHLQYLRFAAFETLFIFSPWLGLSRISVSVALLGLGICIAWYFLMRAYYRRRYGRVKERRDLKDPEYRRRVGFVYLLGALPGLVACYFVFRGQHAPRDFLLLFAPVAMLTEALCYSASMLRRSYYLVAAIATLLTVLSDMIANMPAHQFFHVYCLTFLGSAVLLVAIFDHLLLVRGFRQLAPGIHA